MSVMQEFMKKQTSELKQELADLYRTEFKLRLLKSSGESTQTHKLKQIKKNIARILTILTDRNKGK